MPEVLPQLPAAERSPVLDGVMEEAIPVLGQDHDDILVLIYWRIELHWVKSYLHGQHLDLQAPEHHRHMKLRIISAAIVQGTRWPPKKGYRPGTRPFSTK